MSFSKSAEGFSGAEDRIKSPEEAARIDHEIIVAEEKFRISFRQLSEAIAKVDEDRLDKTQRADLFQANTTLEEAARLSAHA